MLVAMLGAGLAIAGESYSVAAQRDKEQELLFIGAQFRAALRSYHQAQIRAGRREYPATLDDLLKDNRFPGTRRHLRRLYRDPMTGSWWERISRQCVSLQRSAKLGGVRKGLGSSVRVLIRLSEFRRPSAKPHGRAGSDENVDRTAIPVYAFIG